MSKQFVRVGSDGYHFMLEDKPFAPIGFNYFPTGSGWAPQIWADPKPEVWRTDLKRLAGMGTNVIRVFLALHHLMPDAPDTVSEKAMDDLGQMLDIARENGIRVIFSGPNSWEGWPDWFKAIQEQNGGVNPYFTDETVLSALELFYRTASARFMEHDGMFGFDLFNEPNFPFDKSVLGKSEREIYAHQKERDAGCYAFVKRMVKAIKSVDPNHLVSVGLHQWSIPFNCITPADYQGFDPHVIGGLVDYVSFHWYPYCDAEHKIREGDEASYQWNLAQFMATAMYCDIGKPIMYEEFAMYGGHEFHNGWWQLPYISEHTQARWITDVFTRGKHLLTGWIYWGFQDHPCCGDITRYQGFFDDDGNPKEITRWYPVVTGTTREWIAKNRPNPGPADFELDPGTLFASAGEMSRVRTEVIRRAQTGAPFRFIFK